MRNQKEDGPDWVVDSQGIARPYKSDRGDREQSSADGWVRTYHEEQLARFQDWLGLVLSAMLRIGLGVCLLGFGVFVGELLPGGIWGIIGALLLVLPIISIGGGLIRGPEGMNPSVLGGGISAFGG